jgi:putative hydrolase of the HAD superfamily
MNEYISDSRWLFASIEARSGIAVHLLEKDYAAILETATRDAFIDGRSSDEYRQERFRALLDGRGLQYPQSYLASLVEQYKIALGNALQLKPGALQLLQYLKRLGKKIIIITEGPSDAQIWTVQQLGLKPYVDVLVTTNEVGKSKVNGLLTEVLRMHNISPKELVYVGDNQARDIVPATEADILAIHYNENEECSLNIVDNCNTIQPSAKSFLRVDSLVKIQRVMDAREVKQSTSSITPTGRTNMFPMDYESRKRYPNWPNDSNIKIYSV